MSDKKKIIRKLGSDADCVRDGEEGLDLLRQNPDRYGLVLMDVHMPRISGTEATRRIRQSGCVRLSGVPIIALTADESFLDENTVRRLGMNGYARKPVTPGQMLGLIDKHFAAA
jgi:CheY-like chemotaxis protein